MWWCCVVGAFARGAHLALSGSSLTGTFSIIKVLPKERGAYVFLKGDVGSYLTSQVLHKATQQPLQKWHADSRLVGELHQAHAWWLSTLCISQGSHPFPLPDKGLYSKCIIHFCASVMETAGFRTSFITKPAPTFLARNFFIYKIDSFQIVGDLFFVRLPFFFF